ncbi:MAG TPA: PatB family C-S lyase [Methylotenera sp.]|nr:PatB family C-S lyase [Methylotenera sp.]
MDKKYIFDVSINREGTSSVKYAARQAVFGREDVTPLWVADMDFGVPPAITQALIKRANQPIYGYTQYPESLYDSLINWLKHRHGWEVKREWIVMCPGVVPSINAAIKALTQPGDGVIVQTPVYFPFFSSVKDTGRHLIENPLNLKNGHYTMDFEHLEKCAAKAKLLILCSPHNPVGRVWETDELERLCEIARKYDLIIFSDEIHADLIYPEFKHQVLANLPSHLNLGSLKNLDNMITAIAPSKTFNIAGLNLSALIISNALKRKAIAQVFADSATSATNPFSIVAFETAYSDCSDWLDEMLSYLKDTRDFVASYLSNHLPQIKLIPAQGTYLLWLDCRNLGMTDAQLKQFFVHKAGLGLSQGIQFGETGSGFMRMNIGAPRRIIEKALEDIKKALA